jgi:hypothetical protein
MISLGFTILSCAFGFGVGLTGSFGQLAAAGVVAISACEVAAEMPAAETSPGSLGISMGSCGSISDSDLRYYCDGSCGSISDSDLRYFCNGSCGSISNSDMRYLCNKSCGSISNSDLRYYCDKSCGSISNSNLRYMCNGSCGSISDSDMRYFCDSGKIYPFNR